jgi:hypothetical protein
LLLHGRHFSDAGAAAPFAARLSLWIDLRRPPGAARLGHIYREKTQADLLMSFAALVTLINVLVSSGFALTGLIRPELIAPGVDQKFSIFAMYAAARAFPLLAAVVFVIVRRSRSGLLTLGWLAAAIQFADVLIGVATADMGKTLGPFFLGALQSYASYRLLTQRGVDPLP